MKLSNFLFTLLVIFLPTQFGRHFWPSSAYLLGLRIDYLSPTIFLTDLLVGGILLSWLVENHKRHKAARVKKRRKKNFLFFCLFLIFTFLTINSLLSLNKAAAFYKLIKIVEFIFLGIYIAKNIDLSQTFKPLTLAVIYSLVISLGQFIKQSSLGGPLWWFGERSFTINTPGIAKSIWQGRFFLRPYATFSHPNSLAGFVLIGLILTLPYIFRKSKVFGLFYFLFSGVVLTVTYSRSVFFSGLVLFTVYVFSFLKQRQIIKMVFLFFLLLFSISFFPKILFQDESFLRRTEQNLFSLKLIGWFPIFGVGINNFLNFQAKSSQNLSMTYWLQPVHNIFLLVAAETGIIGLLVFFWLFFLSFKKVFFKKNKILFFSLIGIFILGFFDHYWLTLQQNQLLLTLVIGLSLGEK